MLRFTPHCVFTSTACSCPLTDVLCALWRQAGEALSDDFLFPMTSRLSYASSPDSDGEGGAETSPAVSPGSADSRLPRSSSDPSLSAEDGAGPPPATTGQPPPPPYSPYKQVSTNPLTLQRLQTGEHKSAEPTVPTDR